MDGTWEVYCHAQILKKIVFKIKKGHLIREMRFDGYELFMTVAVICCLSPLSRSVSDSPHLVQEFKMVIFMWYMLT